MIVYFWDFEKDRISCVSHTCVTPDLNKRNEQVTKFISTVFEVYSSYYRQGGHGRIKYLSLWSDNCGEQFKNRYHFGWGSIFLRKFRLSAIFFNFFAPGHGKGICDSEGGVSKHAVADAALHGAKLVSPFDLFRWLKEHCVDVGSNKYHGLHSPDKRDYHYFHEGEFLDYHPIDLKIDKINCFHNFCISNHDPFELFSRNTSCFCLNCKLGHFRTCLDVSFHGEYHTNLLNIEIVEKVPDHIDLGIDKRQSLMELRTRYDKPYLVMLFQHRDVVRPTFAMISPGATFNVATVRGHILAPLDPNSNYFNYTKVKIPKGGLCNRPNHQCPKIHTQLLRFDRICAICVKITDAGNIINSMKLLQQESTPQYWVYTFKDSHLSVLEEYKATRVQVFGDYEIGRLINTL